MATDAQAQEAQKQKANAPLPGMDMVEFGAGNNLIGTQVTPTASTRLVGAQGQADKAAGDVADYQFKDFTPIKPPDMSGATGSYQKANEMVQGATVPGYESVNPYDASGVLKGLELSNTQAQGMGSYGVTPGGGGGASGVNFGADVGDARALSIQGLKDSYSSPDRGQLAADAFQLMRELTEPAYQMAQRDVAKKAGALGRVGAGMTTNELGDIYTLRERSLDQTGRDMALQAAGQTLNDQLARISAGQGLASSFGNLDIGAAQVGNAAAAQNAGSALAAANFLREGDIYKAEAMRRGALDAHQIGRELYGDDVRERDVRYGVGQDQLDTTFRKGDAEHRYGADQERIAGDQWTRGVGERDKGLDYDQRIFDNRRGILDDMSNREGQIGDAEFRGREEMRGERGYQVGEEQRAIDNAREQQLLEEYLFNQQFGRGRDLLSAGAL